MISGILNGLVNKKEKNLYFLAFISTIYVTLALTLLFISKENYEIYKIIDIVISIIYGFYTIYFFTCIYKELNETIKEIKIINNALIKKKYLTYVNKELINKYNLDMYKLTFKTLDNDDYVLYSLDDIKLDNIMYLIDCKLDYIDSFKVYENE